MKDTVYHILLRWGIEVEDEVSRIDIEDVTPVRSSDPCLHRRKDSIDLKEELPFCSTWDEYEGFTGSHYCSNFHFKNKSEPADRNFHKMVDLISLASRLKIVELETSVRIQNLIRHPGNPTPPSLIYSLQAYANDSNLDPVVKSYGFESVSALTTEYANNELRKAFEAAPQKFFSNFNLVALTKGAPLAYFEIEGSYLDLLLQMKEYYPLIEIPKVAVRTTRIFLMPLETIKAPHKRRALETKKQVRINQPCWNDKIRGLPQNFDGLIRLGNVYHHPQVANQAEFEETLAVLSKEMPFKDALSAAEALANSC